MRIYKALVISVLLCIKDTEWKNVIHGYNVISTVIGSYGEALFSVGYHGGLHGILPSDGDA